MQISLTLRPPSLYNAFNVRTQSTAFSSSSVLINFMYLPSLIPLFFFTLSHSLIPQGDNTRLLQGQKNLQKKSSSSILADQEAPRKTLSSASSVLSGARKPCYFSFIIFPVSFSFFIVTITSSFPSPPLFISIL